MSAVHEVAEAVRRAKAAGRPTVVGRVVAIKGFSTLPIDEMVAVDSDGTVHGELLGRPGADRLRAVAAAMFDRGAGALEKVTIEIHGKDVQEIGLSCGGQADVLMQPVAAIPERLWDLLIERTPAALVTRISGPGAGPDALVVDRAGQSWGAVSGAGEQLVAEAVEVLFGGRAETRRVVEDAGGEVLIEAWVPTPRMVVVGTGEMVGAIESQGALLGWETQATDSADDLGEWLEWSGATGALIVLSHDPHVDVPTLAAGLSSGIPYVGAMGSRSTQSRRLERLAETGVSDADLARIHRPIGLDLGGRRAPEVALAIVAEILAVHCGRQGRPLKDTDGPIHGRSA